MSPFFVFINMDINYTFNNYGNFDTSEILRIINDENLDWDDFRFRQITFKEHIHTKTIPILFQPDFRSFEISPTKHYNLFKDQIFLLEETLNNNIGYDGHIFRAILVMLVKGGKIPKHRDGGITLLEPKRIHIPIVTNEKCFFTVGDEIKNLQVGEIWEINNGFKLHEVSNDGDEDRIHLIVDWKPNQ